MSLTSRERINKIFKKEKVDRFAIDIGGTNVSTLTTEAYESLTDYLGFEMDSKIMRYYANLSYVGEKIRSLFKADCYPLLLTDESQMGEKVDEDIIEDQWGVKRKKCGYYYDLYEPPLKGEIGFKNLKNFCWPEPEDLVDLNYLNQEAKYMYDNTEYALILVLPLGMVHQAQFIRGFEDWFLDIGGNREIFNHIHNKLLDIHKKAAKLALDEVGELINAVIYAEDLGMQNSLFVSKEMYRKTIKPYQEEYFSFLKENYNVNIIYHSCGAIKPLIDDFIDLGIDALNPVQVSAGGMEDTEELSNKYSSEIIFWGGGCDTQQVFPHGDLEAVEKEVKNRISDLNNSRNNYVFCPVHNIQPEVPPENIVKAYKTALSLTNEGV